MQMGRGCPQRREGQRKEAGLEGSLGQGVLSLNFCPWELWLTLFLVF